MKVLPAALTSALAEGQVFARNFVTVWAKNRINPTNPALMFGFWDGYSDIALSVNNPLTGAVEDRSYRGFGSLLGIEEITHGNETVVRQVRVSLSSLDNSFRVVREYSLEQARIDIHRGIFHLEGSSLKTPLFTRFTGLVDEIETSRGAVGLENSDADGSEISLIANSITAELTRINFLKGSDEHQRLISTTDTGLQYAAVVGDWEVNWGERNTVIPTVTDETEPNDIDPYDTDFGSY